MLARQFATWHAQPRSATTATAMSSHRLLASVAAWGEDVESAEASVLLSAYHWVLEWPSESRSALG